MKFIYALILMSVSGTIMYLLSRIFAGKAKYCVWQYAMLTAAVAMLLVPAQKILEIPKILSVTVPSAETASAAYSPAAAPSFDLGKILIAVWLLGAVASAAVMLIKYVKTAKTLKQITGECRNDETLDVFFAVCKNLSVSRRVTLYESEYLRSPLLFGIIKPAVIIPKRDFTETELEMVLTHELTHYKHRDLIVSLLASIARCVHWFNPAAYFIERSLSEVCELFCDETVMKHLKPADKKAYGSLILSVIETELRSRLAYTTSMASAADSIQKRLRKIAEFKMPTKASTITGIMIVCACAVSSLTAFGFETAAEIIPDEVKQAVSAPTAKPTAAPTEQPAETVYEVTQPKAEVAQTAESYYEPSEEEYIAKEYAEETAEVPETPAVTEKPITSYVFNAEFGESGEAQSGSFSAESGTKLSVRKITGESVPVSVHDAKTGEIIYDEREDRNHNEFSFSAPEGGEYYITAYSENGEGSGIYIYGE